jgi:hypothetical protein
MGDLFASAKSVLRRANHHITDLDSAIKADAPDKQPTYIMEQDKETGDYLHKLRFREAFSDDVSCIMFDAINNLRASLDQMTFAIAVKCRGREDGDFAYFPIVTNLIDLLNRLNGLKDIPLEIRAIFEWFKPYKGGNNALWALNYLANVKKHALLVPVWFGGTTVRIPAGGTVPPFSITRMDTASKNEIVIFRSAKPPQRHPNIEITYNVIIDHPEKIIQGQPPVSLLNAIRSEVERVLVTTEAECRRLGLLK